MLDAIPSPVREAIRDKLQPASLQNFSLVSGGCINHGGKLTTSRGDYFIKWNDRSAYPSMFESETKGLQILLGTQSIRVNEVFGFGECGAFQFIILVWIEGRPRIKSYWTLLGLHLAALHQHTAPSF